MKKPSARKNDFEGMIREFETNIFLNNSDEFSSWCHFRYGREGKNKGFLLMDFSSWLDGILNELRPIKKLHWRIYPEIRREESLWRISTRLSVLRQPGENVKGNIRYPTKAIYGELPMPDWKE